MHKDGSFTVVMGRLEVVMKHFRQELDICSTGQQLGKCEPPFLEIFG